MACLSTAKMITFAVLFHIIPQPAPHVFHHIPAKEPRVGEVEVAFGEHLFIGGDEDHLGVEVGTDSGVVIKPSPCRAGHNEDAIAGIIIFGHA